MIKRFLCTVCALTAAVILSGCSGDEVLVNGSIVEISSAAVNICFPEDWTVFSGDDIYKITYSRNSEDYASADALKKEIEENGERYIVYAESPEEDALALFSMQPIGDSPNEELTVGSLARAVHDNAAFEYRLNGYYTESSFTEENMGGISGWLSDIRIFSEPDTEALSEQREFIFEKDKNAYSLRVFASGLINEQTQNVVISSK